MLEIPCPWCGPRDESEFAYGGEAHLNRPDPETASDREWAAYLYYRDNKAGVHAERWHHTHGCRRWFNAVRDTVTYRFHSVYTMDDEQPAEIDQ
ncbi:sarcosine oxidase subunit delta [Salinisphaera sp. USBA-960]|uniref:sarcosine oxidase subunit delta n=1 Tax=Salinisphaera orenii TaxID=856731 RepID=UPI000DBE9DFB|nr:sarcosine oxidase subunit delta [Salifodinibacter halophilus]NNC26910.1 sarcosine oxidase subunit delta [Salifodinibacter halophilus]